MSSAREGSSALTRMAADRRAEALRRCRPSALPTTAGTGSEAQSFALISDPETHRKMACGDREASCKVAILDPELTLSLPPDVAAATGMDAISHAVESHVTRPRNPISQAFSRQAWALLADAFARVMETPDDIEARGRMLLGAFLAGFAIENSMLGATHSLANPLTARYAIPHGVAIGLMLPHVVRFNGETCEEAYRELDFMAPAVPNPSAASNAAEGICFPLPESTICTSPTSIAATLATTVSTSTSTFWIR